jgi:hypothetical protein
MGNLLRGQQTKVLHDGEGCAVAAELADARKEISASNCH